MIQRRLRRPHLVVSGLLLSLVGFCTLLALGGAGTQPAYAQLTAEASGAVDCVARSQQGQETLSTAMKALLGNDPAGDQFNDATVFVTDELIVGATTADIAAIRALATQVGMPLSPAGTTQVGDLTLQRFVINGDADTHTQSVRRLICEVAQRQQAGTLSATAFVEPNYRTSASQWWGAGSRWRDDSLSQYMTEHANETVTNFAAYEKQWAWGAAGINLRVNNTRTVTETGAGTRVVLFDTSPFDASGRFTMTAIVNGTETPLFGLQSVDRLPQDSFANSAFPDHGPYVAGLVHAVAPEAELELVRVLNNDNGRGTLFDLLVALQEFYDRNGDSTTLDLHGTVLNLSLGVHHPLTETFPSLGVTDTFGLPSEVLSLKPVLRYGYDHGAVIVAAAGNDFAFGADDSPWSEAPAAYDFVISVGGSTNGGTRSCFSNNGELFAPAGDGADSNCSGPPTQECVANPTRCLVSVIHEEQVTTNAGFGYWVGSSFAAPQVSRLAALALGALDGENAHAAGQATATPPRKIAAVLGCGTATGNGAGAVKVIDVVKTLSPTCLALGAFTPGQIRFTSSTASVFETSSAITLTVERINGSDGEVRLSVDTFDGTAAPGQDYPATSLNVDFADGITTQKIAIPIFDDALTEAPETFIVRLGPVFTGQATTADPKEVLVTIIDDESTLFTYVPFVLR